jgi:hypothetical protein
LIASPRRDVDARDDPQGRDPQGCDPRRRDPPGRNPDDRSTGAEGGGPAFPPAPAASPMDARPGRRLSSRSHSNRRDTMTRTLTAALAVAWLATGMLPATAEDKKPAAEKKVTAQQQRMKDCAAKWKDEKKAKDVKGREAYRTFMSGCLKG